MAELLELWLVRHGETEHNRMQRVQGASDVPLNSRGEQQARCLAERLQSHHFDYVYASDLERAYRTAQLALPGVNIQRDARLREINLGIFEGRVWTEFNKEERQRVSVWFMGPYDMPVPEGESSDDLQARVRAWLEALPASGRAIAFTHGGTIAALLYTVTGRPAPRAWDDPGGWGFRLKNTSISKLQISETFITLDVVNDVAHLEGLEL